MKTMLHQMWQKYFSKRLLTEQPSLWKKQNFYYNETMSHQMWQKYLSHSNHHSISYLSKNFPRLYIQIKGKGIERLQRQNFTRRDAENSKVLSQNFVLFWRHYEGQLSEWRSVSQFLSHKDALSRKVAQNLFQRSVKIEHLLLFIWK